MTQSITQSGRHGAGLLGEDSIKATYHFHRVSDILPLPEGHVVRGCDLESTDPNIQLKPGGLIVISFNQHATMPSTLMTGLDPNFDLIAGYHSRKLNVEDDAL